MTEPHDDIRVMRYLDGELTADERQTFLAHLEGCAECRKRLGEFTALKEVTDRMKIADLPEAAWDAFHAGIYNRIERGIGWTLFLLGAIILAGYSIYKVVTDPSIMTIVGLGTVLLMVGLLILLLSVIREKLAVNRVDRYIREVQR